MTKPDRSENFLPYLLGQLGKDDDLIDTAMLKDSGASHSLLDVEEFKRLKKSKNFLLKIVRISMCQTKCQVSQLGLTVQLVE